jgi:peptidoglycan/LPS O-acetylase OafA/YrhL
MVKFIRRDNFDLIRLVAALLVLVGHAYLLMGEQIPRFLGIEISVFGVMIFFCISGYLVTDSWIRDPSALRYFTRRSLRIFPALIPLVLLTTFLLGPALTTLSILEYFSNNQTYAYLLNIFLDTQYFLPEVFKNNSQLLRVNGSLWTLPVEFLMYCLVPLLAFFQGRKNFIVFFSLSLLFSLAYTYYGMDAQREQFLGDTALTIIRSPRLCMFFMAGAAIRFALKDKDIPQIGWATISFSITIFCYYLTPVNLYFFNTLLAFSLALFVNAIGESTNLCFFKFRKIGDLSYGIYLYAFPIQQIISQFFINQISVFTAIMLATIPTVCFAYVSWHLIEKRAVALKPKSFKHQFNFSQ